jgi:hypothetical protein
MPHNDGIDYIGEASETHGIIGVVDGPVGASVRALFECVEKRTPITDSVRVLEERCAALQDLASEILASIQIKGNAHLFKDFPDGWHTFVDNWQQRLDELKNG